MKKFIVEKGSNTCKLILVTSKMNRIILPLQSRCVHIRIPVPHTFDKYIYIRNVLKTNSIFFNDYLLMQLCKKYSLEVVLNKYFYINDNVDLNIKYSLRVKEFIYDPNLNVKKIHSTLKF